MCETFPSTQRKKPKKGCLESLDIYSFLNYPFSNVSLQLPAPHLSCLVLNYTTNSFKCLERIWGNGKTKYFIVCCFSLHNWKKNHPANMWHMWHTKYLGQFWNTSPLLRLYAGPIWNRTSPIRNTSLFLRLHTGTIHESNTFHAWTIHESNPKRLLSLRLHRGKIHELGLWVGSMSRVCKLGPQFWSMSWVHMLGPRVGSVSKVHWQAWPLIMWSERPPN